MPNTITFHRDSLSGPAHAAVNVKLHISGEAVRQAALKAGEDQGGAAPHMPPWEMYLHAFCDDNNSALWEEAQRLGWEYAAGLASDTFGPGYSVASEGRSSGWLVVTYQGRPTFDRETVEGWDAAEDRTWGDFASAIRETAEDTPYQYGALIYFDYCHEAGLRANAAKLAGDDPFGLGVRS